MNEQMELNPSEDVTIRTNLRAGEDASPLLGSGGATPGGGGLGSGNATGGMMGGGG